MGASRGRTGGAVDFRVLRGGGGENEILRQVERVGGGGTLACEGIHSVSFSFSFSLLSSSSVADPGITGSEIDL